MARTEAGKVLASWLTFAAKRVDGVPSPEAVEEVEAEAVAAYAARLRAAVESLEHSFWWSGSSWERRAAVLRLIEKAKDDAD